VVKEFGNTAGATGSHVSSGGGSLPAVSTPAAGKAPTITVNTKAAPPKNLTVTTLLKGTGAPLAKGQTVVVQYTGVIWRTGKVFDSSWSRSAPFGFVLAANPEQVIPGWDKGLVGQTIGSRVMLTIPPADGYGSSGQSSAGIKGTDTLVFVVDILGAVNP
jgi:peptidylprolyl isomerase